MDKSYILVVDDNHINRLFFQSALQKMHHQVMLAVNGYEAVECCQQNTFDVILMDIRMQGLNGIEAAHEIKQIPHCKATPIVAISADVFDHNQHPQFADGLMKPVKPEVMQQLIKKWTHQQPWFDEQLALSISHQDSHIVSKLRTLMKNDLPAQTLKIKQLFEEAQYNDLQDCLHQLLGSARICAACRLVNAIEQFRSRLENEHDEAHLESEMMNLIQVIRETELHAE
ncbi:response regulator [Marinicella sediminis]|uniref:Response regulator n=1 Tax=Marinicella sediminis TaxID=1792834 RepID=A0ABV7JBX3_9GAMM|nr:response regulator [Marinicella sediminis]